MDIMEAYPFRHPMSMYVFKQAMTIINAVGGQDRNAHTTMRSWPNCLLL
jgi:hypothetical protein